MHFIISKNLIENSNWIYFYTIVWSNIIQMMLDYYSMKFQSWYVGLILITINFHYI